jgi:hypothetical protein
MILILDNNSFRRDDLSSILSKMGYIVSCRSLDDYRCYVYPALTVIVNPKRDDINKYIYTSKTKYVVAKDNFTDNSGRFEIVSHSNGLAESIAKEFDKLFPNDKNIIYRYGVACYRDTEFSIGGKALTLFPKEQKLFKFFIHNPNKTFLDTDLCGYFNYKIDPELNLKQTIWKINTKCNNVRRPKLIEIYNDSYRLNPAIYTYDEKLIQDLLPYEMYKK